jgi:hypothetical protein
MEDTAARKDKRINSMRPRLDTRICVLAIIVYPVLLILVNDSWVFGNPLAVTIDDHIYTGYFFNLQQYINVFPGAYFGTRLPWILLGYVVHALAPPELAHYMLRLALCYGAAFSLFAIIRLLFADNFAALIGTFLMITHTGFLSAIGWDYVDGPGIVLILAGTALLTWATRSRHWRLALLCAGAAQAGMVSTHLILAMLVPVQLAWYLAVDRRSSRNSIPASLLFLSLGALGMMGALGGVSRTLSGPFFFLAPQVSTAVAVGHNPAEWRPPDNSWIRHATWLVYPAVASMAGLIVGIEMILARIRGRSMSAQDIYTAFSILQLLIVAGLFVVLEMAGFWLLYYAYYASYLFPFVYIAIAAILARALTSVPAPRAWAVLAGVGACLLASFVPGVARLLAAWAPGSDLFGAVGAVAVAAAIFLASSSVTGSVPIIASAVLALAILNISVADARSLSFPPDARRHAAALAVFDAIRAVQPYDRDGALRFWYNWKAPLGGVFTAISSAYLWRWSLVSNEFPGLGIYPGDGVRSVVTPGERIVILTAQGGWRALADKTLRPFGLRIAPVGRTTIQRGAVVFDLVFVKLQPVDEAPAVDISPLDMSPIGAATLKAGSPGVTVETNAELWSWAGRLPMPKERLRRYADSHAVVRVRLRVSRGRIGIGVVNRKDADFIARQMVPAGPMTVDVGLGIPRLDQAGALIISNWDPHGRSVVDVESISIAAYAVPASR